MPTGIFEGHASSAVAEMLAMRPLRGCGKVSSMRPDMWHDIAKVSYAYGRIEVVLVSSIVHH